MSDTTTTVKTARIKFNWEINLGHLLMIVSFVIPALIYGVGFAADFKTVKNDVARHESTINKLVDNQNIALRSFEVVTVRLADHLDQHRTKP